MGRNEQQGVWLKRESLEWQNCANKFQQDRHELILLKAESRLSLGEKK